MPALEQTALSGIVAILEEGFVREFGEYLETLLAA
jgi:hypothetical protein